ncbi:MULTISPECIES: TolC family protein [Olivibacter]|uniref:TolC family protein n=1 Tax=Olivibacter jilunii TaxID=985016 RepID=A0ABW6AYQ2_9SPHI
MNRSITILALMLLSLPVFAQTLTVQQSKELALKNSRGIKNSKLETEAAKEIKQEAYTKYFPNASASLMGMQAINPLLEMDMPAGNLPVYDGNLANIATATQFAYFPGVNIGLFNQMGLGSINVLQPVYAGNKIKTGNQLASLNVEVKQHQEKISENDVLMKTEQQYWQVVAIQEKQKTLQNYEKFLHALYKQVNDAYKAGFIIKNDLLKVQIAQSELKVNKNKLENGKKLALMQFSQTIGIDYTDEIVLQDDLQVESKPESYYIHGNDAVVNRSEYHLLEKSVEATELQYKMTKGDYLPQVGVGAAGYYLDQFVSGQKGNFNGMVYASVSIPITDWWGGKHKLKEQKLKTEIAENNRKENIELMNLQVEKGWTDLKEAYDKILLLQETLEQADENLRVNQNSYNNGLIQLSDLLEAQAIKVETEDKLTEAKSQYRTNLTNYLQVTGR